MGRSPRKKPDDILAPFSKTNGFLKSILKFPDRVQWANLKLLLNTKKLLYLLGKPLYFLLIGLITLVLWMIYIVGHFTHVALDLTFRILGFFLRGLYKAYISLNLPLLTSLSILRLRLRLTRVKIPRFGIGKISFSWLLKEIAFLIVLVCISAFGFWTIIIKGLPSPSQLSSRQIELSTKIYDRNGILLYKIFKDRNRTLVPLSEVPLHVQLATLAIEDAEFYEHPGFSIRGITRAIIKQVKEGEITGGSTITQQLVKNVFLAPEKTYIRKLKELVLAIEVELTYSKDQILEMYLNEVSYGGTAYGIQEAAQVYFNKDVQQLSLAEAALLAGLPKSPSQFSPFGSNPEVALHRQKEVLRLMEVNDYISPELRQKAQEEQIIFAENKIDIKAPHFLMYVKEILEAEYGKEVVEQGGLEVVTSLDYNVQELSERVVKEEVDKLASLHVGNGAAVVLDPQTGEILAMVGSKNYFDTAEDGNVNVATRLRQPGSSIKVVNYAYALTKNYTAASIIKDTPVTFFVEGLPPYTPQNYEGGFRGQMTLRSALAESRNIPAVKVLASYGVKNMLVMGGEMGISSWSDPSQYGLSLTLGGGDVKLIELANVYATLANYGERPELNAILKVTDHKGKVLKEFGCDQEKNELKLVNSTQASESAQANSSPLEDCGYPQVLDPRVAFIVTDILKDNSARAPTFGTSSYLVIANHPEVAVKTGTSNNLRDNLTVGYTQDYVVAVWVGNNDNSPMARIASGVTGASPIFNKIMSALLASKDSYSWQPPGGLVQLPICPYTGSLACDGCPVKQEWFLEEKRPDKACSPDWFKENKDKKEEREIVKLNVNR